MYSERSFLVIVAGLIVINATIAALVWRQSRTAYHRALLLVWVFGIMSLVAQASVRTHRWMIIAHGVTVFLINLNLADLIRRVLDLHAPWRTHVWLFALCFVLSQIGYVLKLPFWAQALPLSLGPAVPLLDLLWRAFRQSWKRSSATVRCTLFAVALMAGHNIGYAFLRINPRYAAAGFLGFVPAILAVFALSITGPAIILERTAADNARLHRTAERAVAARDEFLMVASHELRTPLASLRLAVQGLSSGALSTSPAKLAPLLRLAERQTDKMARLTDAMLSFNLGGPDAEHSELRRTSTDLVAVVRKALDSVRDELVGTKSTVRFDGPPHAFGNWDGAKLEQAVAHLLSNAIKFGDGKDIELTVATRSSSTTCCVQDHGIGIPPDRLPYVFERFERAVSARHYGGLGLGLFIVRSIVQAHGGRVQVASAIGEGTRICIELPTALEAP